MSEVKRSRPLPSAWKLDETLDLFLSRCGLTLDDWDKAKISSNYPGQEFKDYDFCILQQALDKSKDSQIINIADWESVRATLTMLNHINSPKTDTIRQAIVDLFCLNKSFDRFNLLVRAGGIDGVCRCITQENVGGGPEFDRLIMDYYHNAVEFQLNGSPKFLAGITRGVLRYNPELFDEMMAFTRELADTNEDLIAFRRELCGF